jgi:ribonucleotide monophosphatase NagD (HAD superfamily)
VTKSGFTTAPGALAALYEQLGGTVHYVGKPHRPIYQACLNALEGLELGEIVAIGDSVEHDIKGAQGVGIASAFVMGGIHQTGFAAGDGPAAHAHHLDQLCTVHATRPDWVVPSIAW